MTRQLAKWHQLGDGSMRGPEPFTEAFTRFHQHPEDLPILKVDGSALAPVPLEVGEGSMAQGELEEAWACSRYEHYCGSNNRIPQ